ncbi:MAG: glycosyltransferase, partial [Lachnospiraceae bacterium]|nr:glycosyltransferase [Lachnospiraceae bacterium]
MMGSNRNYFKRGISYFKRNGLKSTLEKAAERISRDKSEEGYKPPVVDDATILRQKMRRFDNPYKFSILVPVYETDPRMLTAMLHSVGDQTYGNWELIIADASADESRRDIVRDFMEDYTLICRDTYGAISDKVTYVRLPVNNGIAANTNAALERADGDYVGLLDHDDVLEITALFDIMCAIEEKENEARQADSIIKVAALYTDEDKISEDGSQYFDPHEKPDFDPVLLCTNNYVCHFFVADTNVAKGVGGFRSGYDGAQDHDFILRCTEGLRRDQILHVPK